MAAVKPALWVPARNPLGPQGLLLLLIWVESRLLPSPLLPT